MKDLQAVLAALGGVENIRELEPCVTRLRVEVVDPTKVDGTALNAAGAHGYVLRGDVVQVVIGPEVDALVSDLAETSWRTDESD